MIDKDEIQYIMPNCRFPEEWVRPLSQAMSRFHINTVQRKAAFLGQIAQESAELNTLQENLSYSPQRIVEVWPDRFADLEAAKPFARNPERLGNCVYADRLGNGSEASGDGFRFRGRGLIQVTGRANYARIGKLLDLPGLLQQPDSLLEPRYAALSAAAFWYDKKLNQAADEINGNKYKTVVRKITRTINGSDHGLDRRNEFTDRGLLILDREFAA